MSLELSVMTNELLAAMQFAGVKKEHYERLQVVRFEVGHRGAMAIATSGVVMGIARLDTGGSPLGVGRFSVPLWALETLKLKMSNKVSKYVTIYYDSGKITLQYGDLRVLCDEVPNFPDWRVPASREYTGEPAEYHPDQVAKVAKACSLMGVEYLGVYPNGRDPGLATIGETMVALICPYVPINQDSRLTASPAWVREDLLDLARMSLADHVTAANF